MPELRVPSLNNVMLVGNLTSDPIYNETQNGTSVINFCVASNKRFKDKSGQIKEDVCFVGVVAWEALARSCYENLQKGNTVLINGELQSRKHNTKDGFTRYIVEIKAKRIQFLNKISHNKNNKENDKNSDDSNSNDKHSIDDNFGYKDLNI